jgi:hypothetical protein
LGRNHKEMPRKRESTKPDPTALRVFVFSWPKNLGSMRLTMGPTVDGWMGPIQ